INATTTISTGLYSYGVTVDGANNIYVSDSNDRILKYSSSNSNATIVAPSSTTPGATGSQLGSPLAIFSNLNGDLYISDTNSYCAGACWYSSNNYRIQKWINGDNWGTTVAGGYGLGTALNQIGICYGIFVDISGNLYVSDYTNHRVTKWPPYSTSGIVVAGNNGSGSNATQLSNPQGVFVDGAGNLFVADTGNNRVQRFAPGSTSGVTVAGGNGAGPYPTQLNQPTSVYVDSNGNVFVLDSQNQRIQQWSPNVDYGVTVFDGSTGVFGMNARAMTMDSMGNIYIADTQGQRIQKLPIISTGICGKYI
ncbi:unnamed protein product, partial [Didymodactylos carnosus]